MLIRITGRATVKTDDGEAITKTALRRLDGAKSKDQCSNYIDTSLAELGITGGHIVLTYEAAKSRFHVTTDYRSPVKLNRAQLKQLTKNTMGQWSDGIGEGDFDHLMGKLGLTIDLLQSGNPKVEQIDDGKKTAQPKTGLAKAAWAGDLETALALLEAGRGTESRMQGFTPLHLSLIAGHWKIALALIEHGADVRARSKSDKDPILHAAMSFKLTDARAAQVANALLERGAPVHGIHGPKANPGYGKYTPLYMAKQRKRKKLIAVLMKHGARK